MSMAESANRSYVAQAIGLIILYGIAMAAITIPLKTLRVATPQPEVSAYDAAKK